MGVRSVETEEQRTKGRGYSHMVQVKDRRSMKGNKGGRKVKFRWTEIVQGNGV